MHRLIVLILLFVAACQPVSSVQLLDLTTAQGSGEPHLSRTAAGEVVLSFLEPGDTSTKLRVTVLEGDQWQKPRTVAEGDNWMVNWADFPSVVPLQNGIWAAHWLVKVEGGQYAYDTLVSLSPDSGQTWSTPVRPHTDSTLTEHGFVSLFSNDENVGVVWLDGRDYANATGESEQGAGTQLRTAVIGQDLQLSAEGVIDDMACDCCQTDLAMAASGPVVVYRNRTSEEIRDIHVARYAQDQWQPGRVISDDAWKIEGCPVNGPAIDADYQTVAVAWFTASPEDRVQIAFSDNSAEAFGPVIDVGASKPVGRVDVALLADGDAVVSWLESGIPGRLLARRISPGGTLAPIMEISVMAIERNSGFPQMVVDGNRLIFAWTDVAEGPSLVKTAARQL